MKNAKKENLNILHRGFVWAIVLVLVSTFTLKSQVIADDVDDYSEDSLYNIETQLSDVALKDSTITGRLKAFISSRRNSPALFKTGIHVLDLTTGKTLYDYNSEQLVVPASTEKVLTSYALQRMLDRHHLNYTDSVTTTAKVEDGVLQGDLHISLGCNPSRKDIQDLIQFIKQYGIQSVNGNVTVSLKLQRQMPMHPHWMPGDLPVSRLGLLYKGKATVMNVVKSAFEASGIQIKGEVSEGVGAKKSTMVGVASTPVADVMTQMLKHSINGYAEMQLYSLPVQEGFGAEPEAISAELPKRVLQQDLFMLPISTYTMDCGSGLSHQNRVTAKLFTNLLSRAYTLEPEIYYYWANVGFPVAGVDGTLRNRMKGTSAERNVRAKTGTLPSIRVSTLVGYCTSKQGHQIAFAILCNGPMSTGSAKFTSIAHAFQDDICRILCE